VNLRSDRHTSRPARAAAIRAGSCGGDPASIATPETGLQWPILPHLSRPTPKKPAYFGNKSGTTVKKPAFSAMKSWSDPIRIV